jgi:nucleoside-diphosphate-sugar epimerase
MKRVLVTGAAGGVGSRVTRLLLGAGFAVRGLVRAEDRTDHLPLSAADLVRGDVRDVDLLRRCLAGTDAVVHCAALLPNALGRAPASAFHEVNVEGALKALHAARESGVRRAVFYSTISVVDHVGRHVTPQTLFDYLPGPHDPYLASKIECERRLLVEGRVYDGQLAIIRPAFIYGPDNYAVWQDSLALVRAGKMKYVGAGDAPLPLIHADDMARFVVGWLGAPGFRRETKVHVLANPEPTTLRMVFDLIADECGVARPGRLPYWPVRLLAEVADRLPSWLRPGRLKLLTRARVRQYSRGYDLSGILDLPALLSLGLTSYRVGIPQMLAAPATPSTAVRAA